jgi:hypothetical protein
MQTDKQVLQELRGIKHDLSALRKLDTILDKLDQQSELICRNFTRQWNYEMKKLEAECPNTFFLLSGNSRRFNPKNWVSKGYSLYLLCQHPPGPHQVGHGYALRKAEDWWITISPWLNHVVTFLKYAVPLSGGLEKLVDPALVKQFQDQLDLLEHITDDIPNLGTLDTMKSVASRIRVVEEQQAVGPALRALHAFLKEQDSNEQWGGLNKTLTPDGNILWLCSTHRQQYEAKRAVI